jgi:hypothetical protein
MAFGLKMLLTVGSLVLVGVILRVMLPHFSGWTFTGRHKMFLVPYNRLGFWACIISAFLVSGAALVRLMLSDMGLR